MTSKYGAQEGNFPVQNAEDSSLNATRKFLAEVVYEEDAPPYAQTAVCPQVKA